VHHDQLPVTGCVHIQLQHGGAHADGRIEGSQRVSGSYADAPRCAMISIMVGALPCAAALAQACSVPAYRQLLSEDPEGVAGMMEE